MGQTSITTKSIQAAKPRKKEFKITIDRGLYIRVAPTGVKTWLIRYVILGHQKQITLSRPFGRPEEGGMSLAEAKALNAEIQVLAKDDIDYQVKMAERAAKEIEEKRQQESATLAIKDLYMTWINDGVARSDGNKYIKQSFTKHLLPALGAIQLRDLNEHDLRNLYRKIIASGRTATAIELSKDVRQMLHWAEKRKPWRALLIDENPADLVDINLLVPTDYAKERSRILSVDEIKLLSSIFDATAEAYNQAPHKYEAERPLKKEVQIAMWICLSTLCRIGELLMTEWKHVNFDERTWFIPASNTKGERGKKRAQLVYLSDFTYRQFKALHALTGDTPWAFPARFKDGHVCLKSASKQIGDRQTKFKKRTKKLSCRVENNTLALGEDEWTPHDLRRTGATQMQKLKIPRDVINLCQNHVIGTKVDRAYLLDDYAVEKREAWHKLGDWLDMVLNKSNVVPMRVA